MTGKWRRSDFHQAQPWMLLQFAPIAFALSILSLIVLPAPYNIVAAVAWLALLAACILVFIRRRRANDS